jgi:hypothetical protein
MLTLPERLAAFVAAALLVSAAPFTDELGFSAAALLLLAHGWRTRGQATVAA